ncbi:MAG: hypothetical protein KGH54_03500 [Candidatus Micrarchaeota archaeon]|nr:hypothetical protein [Candidatus Micrarchaeota archaeon]
MVSVISERFSRGQKSDSAGDPEVLSKIFHFRMYRLDAHVRIRSSGITMEGEYAGNNFRMGLKPSGHVQFASSRGKFNFTLESSSAAEFGDVLGKIRAEEIDVKRMIFKVWSAYRDGISRQALTHKYEMPHDRVGQFELFLRGTEDFGASIIDSRVTIEQEASGPGRLGNLKAPLTAVYRKMFS